MNCSKCKKESLKDVEYAGLKYCEKHFQELMEKRVRRNLRTNKSIKISKEYHLLYKNTPEYAVTELFLKNIFGNKLKIKKTNKIEENTIIPTSLDDETEDFLNEFITNKKKPKTKSIKPLEVLMKKEIELICKINKIPFKSKTKQGFLNNMENKYPGTKFSVFKSKEHMVKKIK